MAPVNTTNNTEKNLLFFLERSLDSEKGITFINNGETEAFLSYKKLHSIAKSYASCLIAHGIPPGSEIIIQITDLQSFISSFWACIIGKFIPVPVASEGAKEQKQKVINIWKKLKNPFILTETGTETTLTSFFNETLDEELRNKLSSRTISVNNLRTDQNNIITHINDNDIAYIQFSSGSTGSPKGVVLTHKNIVTNISDIISSSGTTPEDRFLSWMPLTHDMGLIGVHLTAIVAGASQYLIPTSLFIRRPLLWLEKSSEHNITQLYSPNFGFRFVLNALQKNKSINYDLSKVRIIYNGAEPISFSLCQQFLNTMVSFGLHPRCILTVYGLAEASLAVSIPKPHATIKSYSVNRKGIQLGQKVQFSNNDDALCFVGVGTSVPNCTMRITSEDDEVYPEKIIGNIQIKGENVCQGYYNDKKASKELFTKDGWLKTGDLGFMINNELVITGRSKDLIIVNGRNIYPQDIEEFVYNIFPEQPLNVIATGFHEPDSETEKLILFIQEKNKKDDLVKITNEIRSEVLEKLGLIIDDFVSIKKIPKTTSGKVQRFILREKYLSGELSSLNKMQFTFNVEADLVNENKQLIQRIADIWEKITGTIPSSETSQLLSNQINSLTLTRFLSQLKSKFNIDINYSDLFSNNSLYKLSRFIDIQNSLHFISAPQVTGYYYDLLPFQKKIWLSSNVSYEANIAFNISGCFFFNGHLNLELLQRSFLHLIDRHEILRTCFVMIGGQPKQKTLPLSEIKFSIDVHTTQTQQNSSDRFPEFSKEESRAPFDLTQGPLFRVKIIRTNLSDTLILTFHHIITDGWSIRILTDELEKTYNALLINNTLPDLPLFKFQFKDYSVWISDFIQNQKSEKARTYWENIFENIEPVSISKRNSSLDLNQKYSGRIISFAIEKDLNEKINQVCQHSDITRFGAIIAILNLLFHKLHGSTEINLGTISAGRSAPSICDIPGCFINTQIIKTKITECSTFKDIVDRTRTTLTNNLANDLYPVDLLIEKFYSKHPFNHSLFEALILFQNFSAPPSIKKLGDVIGTGFAQVFNGTVLVPLQIEFIDSESLNVNITYSTDTYDEEQINNLFHYFKNILQQIDTNTDQPLSSLQLLGSNEKKQLLEQFNSKIQPHSDKNILDLFNSSVKLTPNNCALSYLTRSYTYSQLNDIVLKVSGILKREGIQKGNVVAVMSDCSPIAIACILGIFKLGAIYLPLDPKLPRKRISEVLSDSETKLVLGYPTNHVELFSDLRIRSVSLSEIESSAPYNGAFEKIELRDSAYIMYTSGSTGTPKGIIIKHESLADYAQTFINYFKVTCHDSVLQQSSLSFDTSIEEIFPALSCSARVVILEHGGKNISGIYDLVKKEKISIISTTPSVLKELNLKAKELAGVRALISGGEELKYHYVNNLVNYSTVYNTYGPTECTVCSTYSKVSAQTQSINIGKPIHNRNIYILNKEQELVPTGIVGEIYISGTGLAKEYLKNPEATSKSFVPNPFGLGFMYKTGDYGKWNSEGEIEYLGRKDNQIKLRGYRIEFAEITKAFLTCGLVNDAVVRVATNMLNEKTLVAYYISPKEVKDTDFYSQLSTLLPDYMIPSHFVKMDSFPLNINGKVDINAFPLPEWNEKHEGSFQWIDATESSLAQIWEEILGNLPRNRTQNFFSAGGHSIKAAQLLSLINKRFNTSIQFQDIYGNPSIEKLKNFINENSQVKTVIPRITPKSSYDVTYAQKRLWFLEQMQPGQENISIVRTLKGSLNITTLSNSLNTLVKRHESLRTIFKIIDGELKQIVLPTIQNVLTFIKDKKNPEEIELAIHNLSFEEFDLTVGPLFRITLIETEPEKLIFVLVMHHIISDGWSIDNFIRELGTLYNDWNNSKNMVDVYEPLLQYKDFSAWQNSRLSDPITLSKLKKYWVSVFTEFNNPVTYPLDFKRSQHTPVIAETYTFYLENTSLNKISTENDTTLFNTVLTIYAIILFKSTQHHKFLLGTPVSGRDYDILLNQIGLYYNLIPIPITLKENACFSDTLKNISNVVNEAFNYQEYPFNLMHDDFVQINSGNTKPLFHTGITWLHFNDHKNVLGNQIKISEYNNKSFNTTKHDLWMYVTPIENQIEFKVVYNPRLYRSSTIENMGKQLISFSEALAMNDQNPIMNIGSQNSAEIKKNSIDSLFDNLNF